MIASIYDMAGELLREVECVKVIPYGPSNLVQLVTDDGSEVVTSLPVVASQPYDEFPFSSSGEKFDVEIHFHAGSSAYKDCSDLTIVPKSHLVWFRCESQWIHTNCPVILSNFAKRSP